MSGVRADLARVLGRHLVRIMPPSRSDWALGMKAEIEAIDDPAAALAFALGCIQAGYSRRLRTLPGALTAARASIGLVTLLFSVPVLATAHAFRALETPGVLPQVTAGLGLAFMIAGLAMLRRGPPALVGIAMTMLTLNTLGLWANSRLAPLHADVHQALILEGYVLWSLLLLAGLTLHVCGRSSRLATFADRHGWTG